MYKITPQPGKTPPANTIANGYYLELADHQVNLANNSTYTHIIRHIINTSGVQNASEVSVSFSPAFQQVVYHKVAIIRNGIAINQLYPNAIGIVQEETDAADFQYNGLQRAFITLKDVQNGDRIEFAYSVVGFNPVFGNKYADALCFYNSNPIANYFVTIIAPAARRLQLKAFNNAPVPQEQLLGATRVYHWDNPPMQVTTSEGNTPSWYNQYPYTTVTEYNSWGEVVNWALNLFHHYHFPLPAALQAQVAGWRKTANGDKTVFANLATRFVQDQVRYLGLEMGEYTHQPHSPAEVYQHRFGDCKDKALLLASILQQEQVPAYVAMVNTGSRHTLADAAPSAEEFDHAIVAIRQDSGYRYIDPTVDLQRGNLADRYIPAYGYALVVREGQNALQPAPSNGVYKTNIIETIDVRYNDSSHFEVNTCYSGGAADNIRGSMSNSSISEAEEANRQFYAKSYEGIQLAAPLKIADDSINNEYNVRETYSIPDVWRTADNGKQSFDVFAKSVYDHFPDPTAMPANTPLAIAAPHNLQYILELNMPDDWSVSFTEWHTKNESYQFDYVPEVTGRHINLRFNFNTFKDHIPPGLLQQYRDDYKKMLELVEFSLSIKRPQPQAQQPQQQGSSSANQESNVNWPSVWLCFAFGVVFTALFKWLNGLAAPVRYNAGSGEPVRGWLIVLAIGLGATLAAQLLAILQSAYFDASWYATLSDEGNGAQYLLLVKLGYSLWVACGSIVVLYWLLARRDIFPRMFIGFILSVLVGELALLVLNSVIKHPGQSGQLEHRTVQFGRTFLYAAIWITYVLRSERVKNTFVRSFGRRKDDYM